MKETHRILSELRRLGCNTREATIYMHLLQNGAQSVQQIAQKLLQNRLTIHSAVNQMIKKGFLFESRRGKRRLIVAEDPASLLRFIRKKEIELDHLKGNMDYLVKMLSGLQTADHSVPTVRLYDGVEGFKKMLESTYSATTEVLIFSNVDLLSKLVGEEYLEATIRKRAQKGIPSRIIYPPCAFGERVAIKAKQHKAQVRFLKTKAQWRTGIFAWDDNVAILSYTQQRLTCTIIENRDIANFYRHINFEIIWESATPHA